MKRLLAFASVTLILLCYASGASAKDPEWMDHASWCLKPGGATRTLAQQPSQDGNCGQIQAAVLAVSYFSGNKAAMTIATTQTQYQMGVAAAGFACKAPTEQVAIRLLQVCQCHNIAATKSIENNQTEVISFLKSWQRGQNKPC